MSTTTKNLLVTLVLALLIAAGYFAYQQRDATSLGFSSTRQVSENVRANTEIFIARRAILEEITISQEIFEDQRFQSLESYTGSVPEQPVGRENPFLPVVPSETP